MVSLWIFNLLVILLIISCVAAQTCLKPIIPNGRVIVQPSSGSRYKVKDIIRYECLPNHHFKGSARKQNSRKTACNEQGEWEPKPLSCFDSCDNMCDSSSECSSGKCICDENHTGEYCRISVCEMPSITNGITTVATPESSPYLGGKRVVEGTVISFSCKPGYTMSGAKHIFKCTSKGWSHPFPVCEVARKCTQITVANGVINPDKYLYDVNEAVRVTCKSGYELVLKQVTTIICTSDRGWNTDHWGICQKKRCESFSLAHGIIDPPSTASRWQSSYPVGTALRLNCIKGYYYKGISQNIRCQEPPIVKWSSEPGECVLKYILDEECLQEGKVLVFTGASYSCQFASVEKSKNVSVLTKTEKPLIIVISTAGGLLLLLLIVITVVAYQRRRYSRGQRVRLGGAHGDDDRMSLVYYSNDVHVVLPSYDEAMQARRFNNPPPYAQEEERSDSIPIYVSIDEIRTAVSALSTESSFTTSTTNNEVQPPPVPRRMLNAEHENHSQVAQSNSSGNELEGAADGNSLQQTQPETPSSFGIYDGPSDEPIYASVQRILSHSLVLANEPENPVSEPIVEAPRGEIAGTETSVDNDKSSPLSSDDDHDDDGCDSDTAPLI